MKLKDIKGNVINMDGKIEEDKFIDACEKLDGQAKKTGKVIACYFGKIDIAYFPNIDRVLVSDYRSKGLNRTDIRDVKQIQITEEAIPDINIISDNAIMKIRGKGNFLRVETETK